MKMLVKSLIITILFIFSLSLAIPAQAGNGVFEGSVTINALESKTLCNLMVYSTIPSQTPGGVVPYTVSYSPDLVKFVSDIQPISFDLKMIECPSNGEERRQCIKNLCLTGQDDYCRIVCTTFTGPLEFSFDPQTTIYNGAVRDTASFGSANVMNAQAFAVSYTPYDAKLVVLYIAIVIIIVGAGIFLLKRRKGRRAKRKR